MTQTRRPLALLLLGAANVVVWGHMALGSPLTSPDCQAQNANAMTDAAVATALEDGWRGSPSDGSELLYPPTCLPADAQLMVPVGTSYAIVKG